MAQPPPSSPTAETNPISTPRTPSSSPTGPLHPFPGPQRTFPYKREDHRFNPLTPNRSTILQGPEANDVEGEEDTGGRLVTVTPCKYPRSGSGFGILVPFGPRKNTTSARRVSDSEKLDTGEKNHNQKEGGDIRRLRIGELLNPQLDPSLHLPSSPELGSSLPETDPFLDALDQGRSRFADYVSPLQDFSDRLPDFEHNPFTAQESLRTEIRRDLDATFGFSEAEGEIRAMKVVGEEMDEFVASLGMRTVGLEQADRNDREDEENEMVMHCVPVELEGSMVQLSGGRVEEDHANSDGKFWDVEKDYIEERKDYQEEGREYSNEGMEALGKGDLESNDPVIFSWDMEEESEQKS